MRAKKNLTKTRGTLRRRSRFRRQGLRNGYQMSKRNKMANFQRSRSSFQDIDIYKVFCRMDRWSPIRIGADCLSSLWNCHAQAARA